MVCNSSTGEWKVFTGNEIGALLGWWALHCYQEKNSGTPTSDVYMLASTVSSKILRSIAKVEGFNFIETLTGFKWMGKYNSILYIFNICKTSNTITLLNASNFRKQSLRSNSKREKSDFCI